MVGGAKIASHRRGFVGNQVQSDSIFLNTMHNILHYGKVVQNPGDPVLNAPEKLDLLLWSIVQPLQLNNDRKSREGIKPGTERNGTEPEVI